MSLRSVPALASALFLVAGCTASRQNAEPATAAQTRQTPQSTEQNTEQRTALAGTWEGQIEIPGQPLGFVARIGEDGTGSVDVPVQNALGMPLQVTREDGDAFEMLNKVPGADAVLVGRREGDTLRGTFTQRGYSFPFTLKRTDG